MCDKYLPLKSRLVIHLGTSNTGRPDTATHQAILGVLLYTRKCMVQTENLSKNTVQRTSVCYSNIELVEVLQANQTLLLFFYSVGAHHFSKSLKTQWLNVIIIVSQLYDVDEMSATW